MSEEKRAIHGPYHDLKYGFPIEDDNELFCRLVMEINQAGLSWETILKKENGFRKAYHNFNIKKVASYTEKDRKRLIVGGEEVTHENRIGGEDRSPVR